MITPLKNYKSNLFCIFDGPRRASRFLCNLDLDFVFYARVGFGNGIFGAWLWKQASSNDKEVDFYDPAMEKYPYEEGEAYMYCLGKTLCYYNETRYDYIASVPYKKSYSWVESDILFPEPAFLAEGVLKPCLQDI